MIDPNNNRWRPVRIRNEASVRYLNRLFAAGWYLMDLGLDDLPFLAFMVPLEPGKRPKIPNELKWSNIMVASLASKGSRQILLQGTPGSMPVLVLTKGREKGKQNAVGVVRDESGYIDLSRQRTDLTQWRLLLSFPMEEPGYVLIYERREQK